MRLDQTNYLYNYAIPSEFRQIRSSSAAVRSFENKNANGDQAMIPKAQSLSSSSGGNSLPGTVVSQQHRSSCQARTVRGTISSQTRTCNVSDRHSQRMPVQSFYQDRCSCKHTRTVAGHGHLHPQRLFVLTRDENAIIWGSKVLRVRDLPGENQSFLSHHFATRVKRPENNPKCARALLI